mgnify:CR=1 FL=1
MADEEETNTGLPVIGKESSLSNWAGPYVTDMLGQGQGLADMPYEAYEGPLTAGASDLQEQQFSGLEGINIPTGAMGDFTAQSIGNYMNPYLELALQPQIDEAQRQANIARVQDQADMISSGSFGGSRAAVLQGMGNRALQDQIQGIVGTGYKDAYDKAFGAQESAQKFGLDALQAQGDAGAVQRAIDAEGIKADKAQFEEERDYPFKAVQYMQSLLQGLPIAAQAIKRMEPTFLEQLKGDTSTALDFLKQLGLISDDVAEEEESK